MSWKDELTSIVPPGQDKSQKKQKKPQKDWGERPQHEREAWARYFRGKGPKPHE